jgi:hypothetical protein
MKDIPPRWMPDSGYGNLQRVRDPVMNSSSDEELVDKVYRLEQAVRDLIGEGDWILDHQSWLEAAAARAGVVVMEARKLSTPPPPFTGVAECPSSLGIRRN